MTKLSYFIIATCLSLTIGCSDPLCELEVTYNKATAIYADLDQLRIENINEAPRLLQAANKIYVSDQLLLISERKKGIHVYDNSDPTQPKAINFLNLPGNSEMLVEGTTIYADNYYDMLKIDLTNPTQARIADRINEAFPALSDGPSGTKIIGFDVKRVTEKLSCDQNIYDNDFIYYDHQQQQLASSAIPTAFVSNGSLNTGTANRMAKVDNFIFAIDHQKIYSFEDQSSFDVAQSGQHIGRQLETIYALEDHLFIGSTDAMLILKVEDDAQVRHQGQFFHNTACDPVLPTSEDVAYFTLRSGDECPGDENALYVIDISSYENTQALQTISMQSPYGMTIYDGKLYVGEGTNGFTAFDIDDQQLLTEVERHSHIEAYDIIVHPSMDDILLFASPDGISQFKVKDKEYTLLSQIKY